MKKPKVKSAFDGITLTYGDMTAYLKCSRWTVYNRVKDGSLPYIRLGKKTVFLKEDIDRLFKIPESATVIKNEGIES